MRLQQQCLTMAVLVAVAVTPSRCHDQHGRHQKRQVTTQGVLLDTPQDRQPEQTLVQPQQAAAPPLASVHAHAKFFQDFFSVQLSPHKIEFGHVCEDPNTWEQRYERKDFKNHRDMGKVRWGDKHGGYGEHYWDYNHAGHGGDSHDEPSDNVHEYEEYGSDGNRNKRNSKHHPETNHNLQASETQQVDSHERPTETKAQKYRRSSSETREMEGRHRDRPADVHQEEVYQQPQTQRLKKATKPELYLDEKTGRIVDKATGQAYTLQPV